MNTSKALKKRTKNNLAKPKLFPTLFTVANIILGLLSAGFAAINYMFKLSYQNRCEEYYGIPGKYFSADINSRLMYLVFIVLLIVSMFFPLIIKMYEKSRGNCFHLSLSPYIFISICLGITLGISNWANTYIILNNLLQKFNSLGTQNAPFNIIQRIYDHGLLLLCILCFTGVLLSGGLLWAVETKRSRFKKLITIVTMFLIGIHLFIIFESTITVFEINVENQTKYEIASYEGEQYVVLSEKDDEILVVKMDDGKLNTDQYWFLNRNDCTFSYVDIQIS